MLTKEQRVLKVKCLSDFLFFARYIFKENTKKNFTISPHFIQIAKVLTDVVNGKITRLIINIPPRYGKTELAVKMFIAWALLKNSQSKFIHLSYSDDLALDNSSQTKEYICSDAYQKLKPMRLKQDAQGKKKWMNEDGGGVYATSSGGAITGFGAGVADSEEFAGAIIIDDPLKPDDAFSEVKRKFVNKRYNNTIRSRINDEKTPIILIMQRLHEEDLSGFLLDGGSGEEWYHLCLPALNENNEPLYPQKHSFEDLELIRQADKYTFAGQYQQKPSPDEGGEWKRDWFNIINEKELPEKIHWECIIDGAYTKETKNDPTGIQVCGKHNGNLYIFQSIDKYLELPQLLEFIPTYLEALPIKVNLTLIEPKASGKSLKQTLQSTTKLPVSEISTKFVNVSKIERARSSSPYIEGGRVYLVKGKWNDSFLDQIAMFPNAKHDEHIDMTAYAIERNLIISNYDIR